MSVSALPRLQPGDRAFVLVAGIPGAGKSTLLRELSVGAQLAVLDSEPLRARLRSRLPAGLAYRHYRPLVHLWHRARIVAAALGGRDMVVAHLPATWAYTRWWLGMLAVVAGRHRYLVWVEADPESARAGQCARGRVVNAAGFARHVRRGRAFAGRLRAGRPPAGWLVTVRHRAIL
ncbi:MAG: AAA family ATPase [Pseudonocardia sp.]|jgi:hypothetical protein